MVHISHFLLRDSVMPPTMKLTDQTWERSGDRKLLKHIQEKRRRERMNHSLEVLRTLLLEATEDQKFRNPKTEKAEILKMTVDFLKVQPLPDDALQEEQKLQKYRSGHRECLIHASQFLKEHPKLCAEKRAFLIERISHSPLDSRIEKEKETGNPAPVSPTQVFRRIARGHFAQRGLLLASPPPAKTQTLQNSGISNSQDESIRCQRRSTSAAQESTCCQGPNTSSPGSQESHPRPENFRCPESGRTGDIEPSTCPSQDPPIVPTQTTVWRPWP